MIILRQKTYSVGKIIQWAKDSMPKISKNILYGLKSFLSSLGDIMTKLKNSVKHIITRVKENKDHDTSSHNSALEKTFSDMPRKADLLEYCEAIPSYDRLMRLQEINKSIIRDLPGDMQEFIWRHFPSFLVLASPKQMNEYRKDYMNNKNKDLAGDYTEVLFTYGNELVYLWDFDVKAWYVQDRTYSPQREWEIDGNILDAIKINFDPKKNSLLKMRLEKWEKMTKDEDLRGYMRWYCNFLLQIIDQVKKD